jgi:hypothetical protein
LNEGILGVGVQLFALNCDSIRSLLRATDVIDTRLTGEAGKFFECVFANAAGGANEDGDEARGKGGGDTSVRSLDRCKGDHLIYTIVSDGFNVVKDLKGTNQIVSFGRSRHMICLRRILVRGDE